MIAAVKMISGSLIFLKNINTITDTNVIIAVGKSTILRIPIMTTAPTKAPITAAVMPSTNALIEMFLEILLMASLLQ